MDDGWICMEIRKGMYGLKQASLFANIYLRKHLAKYGYFPIPYTPGWKHATYNITFCLVIDNFGVKHVGAEHAKHLVKALHNLPLHLLH
jgi:hypothetical protein